jgi:hypothetical protein
MSEFQSNTTSNVNPLLARYGYLPGSPTMSPQTSRLLRFFLEGGPKPYSIAISINTNVDQLKATIQQRVKILCDTVDPDDLKLLKVVSSIPRACAF